jgi:hypothetical protein
MLRQPIQKKNTVPPNAMEESFGKKPVPTRGGGSIPIVALFGKELGLKRLDVWIRCDSFTQRAFGLFNFYKGIETIGF